MTYPDLCKLSGMGRAPCGPACDCGDRSPVLITIFFVRGRGLLSRLISWQTWGNGITHCGIMDEDGDVIHATLGAGVEETRLERTARVGERIETYVVSLPHCAAEHLWSLARQQVGKRYDILGNLGFVLRRRVERRSKWFCSELVAWVFHQVGRPLLARVKWWQVSPADLHRSPSLLHHDDWIVTMLPGQRTPYLKWVPPLPFPPRPRNAQKGPSTAFSENPPTDTDEPPISKMQRHATAFSSDPRPSDIINPDFGA